MIEKLSKIIFQLLGSHPYSKDTEKGLETYRPPRRQLCFGQHTCDAATPCSHPRKRSSYDRRLGLTGQQWDLQMGQMTETLLAKYALHGNLEL